MNKVQRAYDFIEKASVLAGQQPEGAGMPETAEDRVTRIYAHAGGPLVGWLLDECSRRGQLHREMASELGVTSGYINQLRSGLRKTEHISRDFAVSCARYLGVAPVVVMIVSGRISMSDFVCPAEPESVAVERAFDAMMKDPAVRVSVPSGGTGLNIDAKRSLVLLYANGLGQDVLGLRELPETVRWLQRAAVIHDESCGAAVRGHRDYL